MFKTLNSPLSPLKPLDNSCNNAASSLISPPPSICPPDGDISDLRRFKQEVYVRDLEHVRDKYALRLQKGIAEKMIKDKHAREMYLFLELKPLFISGVIFAHEGKLPYRKVADFIGEGISTIRKKIAILKRLKLIHFDRDKNLHLAKYDRLREILKHEGKRKYKLLNNGETQYTVKQIAIYENLKKQEYRVRKKILERELTTIYYERKMLDPINSNRVHPANISKGCEQYFSKNFIRKYSRQISKYFTQYQRKYQNVYNIQVQQLAVQYPALNPQITLSYSGIARVLNRKSKASGVYQYRALAMRGYLDATKTYLRIPETSSAIYESLTGLRRDIFSFRYPTRQTRSGLVRKYFRNAPNTVVTLTNATFY